jgi:5-methyltetrahydropteroyltriglutamate--homocysteine methyltransferase
VKNAPFRAEHIGSLPRPKALLEARKARTEGKIGAEALKAAEDAAIRDAVALQERIGIEVLTDGEMTKTTYRDFLFENCEGFGEHVPSPLVFRQFDGKTFPGGTGRRVIGKVRRIRPLTANDFAKLKTLTKKPIKANVPAPSTAHLASGDAAIDKSAYPDRAAYFTDLVQVFRDEIADLGRQGCTYLQMDEVPLALLCDPKNRDTFRARGEDPDKLIGEYIDLINRAVADRPKDMTIAVHMCRGNIGHGMADGGYEPIAERMFGTLDVDGYFLEYDTPRAGDFKPLRFLPKGKKAVLGLMTTKQAEVESKDALKRRIDEAAKVVPLDQLGLSPQCGFASAAMEDRLPPGTVEKKLARIVEVAKEVWG